MSNFITLGMNGEPVEIDSELEIKIAEIFNSQYEYIFSVDEGDYIKRLDESFNEVKAALIALLMPYIFSGAKYAIDLIRGEFPGYDEDVTEELLATFSEHIEESLRKIHETTRRRLIALLQVSPNLTFENYKTAVIGNRPFVINEYEGVFLFNRGIIEILKKTRFVYFVKWNTSRDEKVCKICKPLDGVIMPVAQATIPPIHFGCRCKLAFVLDKRLLMRRYKTQ